MLDNTISPGNYAYQFRVDILTTTNEYQNKICNMLTEEEFADWVCSYEIGAETGKPHYQCILWSSNPLSQKERNRIKAKYFRKNRDSKNSISFTDAKKISNLTAYVMKDASQHSQEMELICSLSPEKREKIPEWLTKNGLRQKFEKELETELVENIIVQDSYGRYPSMLSTAKSIVEYYLKEDHAPPGRAKLFKLLLKHHPEYLIEDYLTSISFIN